ncbi:regulator of telomere elongation helicase 1 homolog [Belonocnema kinseyi]|uniref:regulator of telomere elongation helicase 1 homolog n=1 Tax=Belonocnema kinseyi TaxID=2817044 RepID=UPI00143DB107|nr:regulator of telomere elongation helicase 1 homolog [Belonocnema kinseyi]
MAEVNINGVIVTFPFKPYKVQEDYMSKVIECLQNGKHGVLESPTGTGKTLCLLCSSLSWLLVRKAQIQAQSLIGSAEKTETNYFAQKLAGDLEMAGGSSNVPEPNQALNFGWGMPKIIYASRTHSQLSQAMQELKRTSYKHVKVAVLGSRDQLCIHPEVMKEHNTSNKIHMCQVKVRARTCHFYNNIESRKDDPIFTQEILDIEDLVKAGQKAKCCPYFLSREIKQKADITFMPYNYLLDPKSRRSQGIELQNSVILLDEAHNVEKTCEEAASLQISSTDVALCIDEVTSVMKDMSNEMSENDFSMDSPSVVPKDFSAEDLCILKAMFLELEKAIDDIKLDKGNDGKTFPGGYIFDLLEKADLTHGKEQLVIEKLDKIIQYLSTTSTSPFARKGNALQKFNDLLRVAFVGGASTQKHRERIKQCYKVYVQMEEQKKGSKKDGWEKKIITKSEGKLISYWCFSPGFGMQQLIEQGVRSVILTSGTLSPLKPFISELGIPIDVQLENPHIVTGKQVCVGVLANGPDGHQLNSSYNTRSDPRYIASLGQTVYNFSILIPNGLLVFFPSYPIMKKCQEDWQMSGLWTKIMDRKQIYVEPQSKETFITTMNDYYEKIRDPSAKGAIFMAVCRGKVSEGLDFADMNGRAVLITGLPYPPMKDPRVILKQRYLEENKSKDSQNLNGQQWYQLEASRAVNQAIGRIIRHKDDYGAIILCDCRFDTAQFKSQVSAWLRPHIKKFTGFGMVVKELKEFFRYTDLSLPQPKMKNMARGSSEMSLPAVAAQFNFVSKSQSKPQMSIQPIQKVEVFDSNSYIEKSKSVSTETRAEVKDPFLETKAVPVINLKNCKLENNKSTCELLKPIPEAPSRKRKFRVDVKDFEPIDFEPTNPEPSTSGCSSLNLSKSFEEKSPKRSSAEFKTNGADGNLQMPDQALQKREMGEVYLKLVKKKLSREKYKLFGQMIRDYTNEKNFEKLLDTLIELYCTEESLLPLFVGFRSFVKKEHVEMFDAQVKLLGISYSEMLNRESFK